MEKNYHNTDAQCVDLRKSICSRLNGKSPCIEAGVKYQLAFWYDGWKITPPLTEAEMLNLYQNFDLPKICEAIKDL